MGKPLVVVALLALAFGGAGSRSSSPVQGRSQRHGRPFSTRSGWGRSDSALVLALDSVALARSQGESARPPPAAERRAAADSALGVATAPLFPPRSRHGGVCHGHKDNVRTKQRTPTAPPPSKSSSGSVHFDGSAKNMSKLYSVGVNDQGQSPSLWTCLCFNNNSMSLVADSRYGKAYKVAVGPGDRNPWNTAAPASNAAGQVSRRRDNDLGKWDWYAVSVKVDSWVDLTTAWADIISVGYQTSSGDQVRLGLKNNNGSLYFEVSQNSGYANNASGYATGSVHYTQPILPVTFGSWREFVVGIKWATDNTGAVQVYSRTAGGSWSKAFERLNEPTYLYGTTSYGTFAQDGSNWPTVIDKLGLYYGCTDKTNHLPDRNRLRIRPHPLLRPRNRAVHPPLAFRQHLGPRSANR